MKWYVATAKTFQIGEGSIVFVRVNSDNRKLCDVVFSGLRAVMKRELCGHIWIRLREANQTEVDKLDESFNRLPLVFMKVVADNSTD